MRMIFAAILAITAQAQQQPAARPEFEVVSVKPGDPASFGSSLGTPPGRVVMRNATFRFLLKYTYHLSDYQLDGGPKWMDSAKFDIDAELPVGAPMSQAPAMLQAMLEDRFQLRSHRETRNVREYALIVAQGGPKFGDLGQNEHPGANRYMNYGAAGEVLGRGRTAPEIADMLVDAVGAPVIDQTGLTGKYDFDLKFAPVSLTAEADQGLPTIFTAVQKLGLKLEAIKGPVEVLVIDHAEMPTPN